MSPDMTENVEGFRLSPQQRHLWRLQNGDDATGFRMRTSVLDFGDIDAL